MLYFFSWSHSDHFAVYLKLITTLQIICQFSSVQFSRSVVSDSSRPHESQHARPPCTVILKRCRKVWALSLVRPHKWSGLLLKLCFKEITHFMKPTPSWRLGSFDCITLYLSSPVSYADLVVTAHIQWITWYRTLPPYSTSHRVTRV